MNDKLNEECGIVGISSKRNFGIYNELVKALVALQHRGQDGAGLYIDGDAEIYVKNVGLAKDVFISPANVKSNIGIGHVRYATCGNKYDYNNLQPICCNFNNQSIKLAHNGHIVNYEYLKGLLKSANYEFQSTSDSEIIAALLCMYYDGDMVSTIKFVQKLLVGAYSIVALFRGQLIAFRDPYGIRPMVVGKKENSIIIASETIVFDALQAKFLFEPESGEIVAVESGTIKRYPGTTYGKRFCAMEFVYFSSPESQYSSKSVVQYRQALVRQFAFEHNLSADIIIGIPDTAIPYAKELSRLTGVEYFGLSNDENFFERSFIKPTQPLRNSTAKSKLDFIDNCLAGKSVIVVDDSIVRGTTAKAIVKALKQVNIKEIHFAIISPMLSNPCWMGLDIATKDELLCGSEENMQHLAQLLNVDSICFLSLEGLYKALETENLCCACFNGNYPCLIEHRNMEKSK
jgi:amidophosphoribosyltransferase